MMKIFTKKYNMNYALLFIAMTAFNFISLAQGTADGLCIIPGQPFTYQIPLSPQSQVQPTDNKCVRIDNKGVVTYIGGTDPNCCGKDSIRYFATNSTGGGEFHFLVYTIKCAKPDCGLVKLNTDPPGPTTPNNTECLYACEKSVATYFVTHTVGNVYTWTVTGGTYVVNSPGSIDVTWGPMGSGNISLTITNGTSVQNFTFCVNILLGPTAAFTPLTACVCKNSPISFQNNSLNGSSYYWDFGDGNTSTAFSPTHTYANGGTYTVVLVVTKDNYDANGKPLCCCSDSTSVDVIVEDKEGPKIYWLSTLCEGDSSKYWTNAAGCNYTWTVQDANGNPVSFSGQGNDTICVAWGTGPHGVITLQLSNCSNPNLCTKPVSVQVPIIPSLSTVSGPTKVCKNASATYCLPKWMTVEYDWTVMGGTVTSVDTSNHCVTILWGNGPTGMITVNYHSDFLQGLPNHGEEDCKGVAVLKVNILPQWKINPSANMFCQGTSYTFGAMPALAPGGYHWSISPPIAPVVVGTSTYTVNWTLPGNYVITAYPVNGNIFCNDTIRRTIKVIKTPAVDSISGNFSICQNSTEVYTANTTATGTFFTWTVVGATPASYTGNPIIVTWNNVGPYSISVIQTSLSMPQCPSTAITKIPVLKSIIGTPVINGPNACTSEIQNYNLSPLQVSGATYTWSISTTTAGSIVSGQGTASVGVQWNNVPGSATITCVVNLCGINYTYTKTLTLTNALVPTITQGGFLCPGGSATLSATPGFTSYIWSSIGAGPSTIPITSPGLYVLTTTDINGCKAISTKTAVLSPLPIAQISTPSPTNICVTPTSSGTIVLYAMTNPNYTYSWICTPPSGPVVITPNSPTATTFVHNITSVFGTWSYQLKVTDIISGCMAVSNVINIVQQDCVVQPCTPQPVSISGVNSTPYCNQVTFSHSPNFTVGSWNFGDPPNAYSGSINNPVHTFSAAGYYVVWANGSAPNLNPPPPSCAASAYTSVCIPVAASFTITPGTCGKYTFTNTSTVLAGQSIASCQWTFGDASPADLSCGPMVMHTYNASGTFTVTLLVTSSTGCQATYSQTINVMGPPIATFTMTDDTVCVGESIMFMPSVTTNVLSYLWSFGDGSFNAASSPKHSYLTPGSKIVKLVITNIYGCKDSTTQTVFVHPLPTVNPIAISPSSTVCAGTTVTLTASATGAAPFSYMWNTGATTASINVTMSGSFKVTITDANGCKGFPDSVKIIVRPAPPATISGSHFICGATASDCITLSAPPGIGYTYAWSNGGVGQTTMICGNAPSSPVFVTVTDANGCTAASAPWVVNVVTPPTVAITVVSGNLCEGDTNVLAVTTILPNVIYQWNTGSNATGIITTLPGTYTVIATDTITGCTASASVTVNPKPDLCLVPTGCYKVCIPDTLCGPPGLSSYQWHYNGAPITGGNVQCIVVTKAGSYNLTASNSFGCFATSDSLYLETMICCDSNDINVTAAPVPGTECCWKLSYTSMIDSIFAIQITGLNANIVASMIAPPFALLGSTPNSVTLVNTNPALQLPTGTISNFIQLCFNNLTSSPVNVQITWFGKNGKPLCHDSLKLECKVEPPCMYIKDPRISCINGVVTYNATVCNPSSAAFTVNYLAINPVSPAGIIVTPNNFSITILPGACVPIQMILSGGNFSNQNFCFRITAHNANPNLVDSTKCCTFDSTYCIRIPGCNPCDKVAIDRIKKDPNRDCCYYVDIYNGHSATAFTGVMLNVLTTGSTFTVNNLPGSNWNSNVITPVMAAFTYNQSGGQIPLGITTLPMICINANNQNGTQIELQWKGPNGVICRDTFTLDCSKCGDLKYTVKCNDNGTWVIAGTLINNTNFNVTQATITWTTPGLSAYNQTINVGNIPPGMSYGTFFMPMGAPAVAGQTIMATVTLHNERREICCNFVIKITLPNCGGSHPSCDCDHDFAAQVDKGINCTISGLKYTFTANGTFNPQCDKFEWVFGDGTSVSTLGSTPTVMHTYAAPGKYQVCLFVIRTTPTGKECKFKFTKDIKIKTASNAALIAASVMEIQQVGNNRSNSNFSLYPNPTNDVSMLQFDGQDIGSKYNIQLMDIKGAIIRKYEGEVTSDLLPIDLSNYNNGLYILKINTSTMQKVVKVIKAN
jgi:PKD repeat protein